MDRQILRHLFHQIICFVLSFQIFFLNNLQYWHFLYSGLKSESNLSQSIFIEKFDQSILVIGGLLLKIQAWAFFIVLGAYREIQRAKDSSVIDLEVPDID